MIEEFGVTVCPLLSNQKPIICKTQPTVFSTVLFFNFFVCIFIDSNCRQTVTVLLRFATIWLKVKVPIPKFAVTIYRLSYLWPLKRTVHFFNRSDNFTLHFFHPMSLSVIVPAA